MTLLRGATDAYPATLATLPVMTDRALNRLGGAGFREATPALAPRLQQMRPWPTDGPQALGRLIPVPGTVWQSLTEVRALPGRLGGEPICKNLD